MTNAYLTRTSSSHEGTFGLFRIPSLNFNCFTLECPDYNNEPIYSCVPVGTYKVVQTYSPRFKRHMYLLLDVPSRSGIRIHAANVSGDSRKGYIQQLNGCIALGYNRGTIKGQQAILTSQPAVSELSRILENKPFTLTISNFSNTI